MVREAMEKPASLADFLGVPDPRPVEDVPQQEPSFSDAVDIVDPSTFCKRIVGSREFRQYIMNGIVLGDLPSAIGTRLMDHAWGKPPERVEHTGKDGGPIEAITEIRRVIVKAGPFGEMPEAPVVRKEVTH